MNSILLSVKNKKSERFNNFILSLTLKIVMIAIAVSPSFVSAQGSQVTAGGPTVCTRGSGFGELMDYFSCFIGSYVMRLILTLMLMGFMWGILKRYMLGNTDQERIEGRKYIMWSLFGFFVAFTFVGIVAMFGDFFGLFFGGTIKPVQFGS